MRFYILKLLLLSLLLTPKGQAQTANPDADPICKQVLSYISSLGNDCSILYSQDLGHGNTIPGHYVSAVQDLATQSGVLLPMIGGDYGLDASYSMSTINTTLESHWNQSKLVTISWHLPNPWTGGETWDTQHQGELEDLLSPPGTPHYNAWRAQLDEMAAVLADLKNRGVVILWRPLHEATRFWFWYGHENGDSPAGFIALWRHMFDYFTDAKGLDNLIWVYSAGEASHPVDNSTHYCYPGDDYVDIVGVDLYHDDLSVVLDENFDDLIALGKPFAITEFGPDIPNDPGNYDYRTAHNFIKSNYPEVTYFHTWHSWQHDVNIYHHNTYIENLHENDILQDACHSTVNNAIFSLIPSYDIDDTQIEILHQYSPDLIILEGSLGGFQMHIYNEQDVLIEDLTGISAPIIYNLNDLSGGTSFFLSVKKNTSPNFWIHNMIK